MIQISVNLLTNFGANGKALLFYYHISLDPIHFVRKNKFIHWCCWWWINHQVRNI